ncbi:hypothetical protein B9Z55_007097 [Caenorhabditis nigoni]|uniref:Homeobox domain-containing protein n=1 Tax=Caenorhabditis nigoni TaxID=1611254 RepID=A0A2G5V891_9PELO|nr:hypothetical protein B9Z55_007097 [Caenorhabditis nigoni]
MSSQNIFSTSIARRTRKAPAPKASKGPNPKRRALADSSESESETDIRESRPKKGSARYVTYDDSESDFEYRPMKRKPGNIRGTKYSEKYVSSSSSSSELESDSDASDFEDQTDDQESEELSEPTSSKRLLKRKSTYKKIIEFFENCRKENGILDNLPLSEEQAHPILMEVFEKDPFFNDYGNIELKNKIHWAPRRVSKFLNDLRKERGLLAPLPKTEAEVILMEIFRKNQLFSDFKNADLKKTLRWPARKIERWFLRQRNLEGKKLLRETGTPFDDAMERIFQKQQYFRIRNKKLEIVTGGDWNKISKWLRNKRRSTLEAYFRREISVLPSEMANFEALHQKYNNPLGIDAVRLIEEREKVCGQNLADYLLERWRVVAMLQEQGVHQIPPVDCQILEEQEYRQGSPREEIEEVDDQMDVEHPGDVQVNEDDGIRHLSRRQRQQRKLDRFNGVMENVFQRRQFVAISNEALEIKTGYPWSKISSWLKTKRREILESYFKEAISVLPREMATFERLHHKYNSPFGVKAVGFIELKENVSGSNLYEYLVDRQIVMARIRKEREDADVDQEEEEMGDEQDTHEEDHNAPDLDYQMDDAVDYEMDEAANGLQEEMDNQFEDRCGEEEDDEERQLVDQQVTIREELPFKSIRQLCEEQGVQAVLNLRQTPINEDLHGQMKGPMEQMEKSTDRCRTRQPHRLQKPDDEGQSSSTMNQDMPNQPMHPTQDGSKIVLWSVNVDQPCSSNQSRVPQPRTRNDRSARDDYLVEQFLGKLFEEQQFLGRNRKELSRKTRRREKFFSEWFKKKRMAVLRSFFKKEIPVLPAEMANFERIFNSYEFENVDVAGVIIQIERMENVYGDDFLSYLCEREMITNELQRSVGDQLERDNNEEERMEEGSVDQPEPSSQLGEEDQGVQSAVPQETVQMEFQSDQMEFDHPQVAPIDEESHGQEEEPADVEPEVENNGIGFENPQVQLEGNEERVGVDQQVAMEENLPTESSSQMAEEETVQLVVPQEAFEPEIEDGPIEFENQQLAPIDGEERAVQHLVPQEAVQMDFATDDIEFDYPQDASHNEQLHVQQVEGPVANQQIPVNVKREIPEIDFENVGLLRVPVKEEMQEPIKNVEEEEEEVEQLIVFDVIDRNTPQENESHGPVSILRVQTSFEDLQPYLEDLVGIPEIGYARKSEIVENKRRQNADLESLTLPFNCSLHYLGWSVNIFSFLELGSFQFITRNVFFSGGSSKGILLPDLPNRDDQEALREGSSWMLVIHVPRNREIIF